jgi:hypothetical protein
MNPAPALSPFLLLVLLGCALAAPTTIDEKAQPSKAAMGRALRDKLARPADLDKGIDANTPLRDALDHVADKWDLPIVIDSKAFETIGVQKVEEQPVQLPRTVGPQRATALRMLLAQIKGDEYSGTFLVRGDHLLITTTFHANPSCWSDKEKEHIPTVDADFDRRPLCDALQEIADGTGINVLVDQRIGDPGRIPVTARFQNTRIDAAVRLLAEMADLKSVAVDNVLFVTTADRVRALQGEARDKTPKAAPK